MSDPHRAEKAPDTGFTRLTFFINEGQRALLHKVRFEGNTIFSERELRKVVDVGDRDWWRVWNWTKRLNNEKIDKTVEAIEAKYQDNGYMNAQGRRCGSRSRRRGQGRPRIPD